MSKPQDGFISRSAMAIGRKAMCPGTEFAEATNVHLTFSVASLPFVFSADGNFALIGTTPTAGKLIMTLTHQFTVNANGTMTVNFFNQTVKCH